MLLHSRVWIYSVNMSLVLLQLLFLHTFWSFANQPLLQLLPVRQARALLVFLFCTVTLQFLACFCGLAGAYFSVRQLVRVYWLLMIPLILADTAQAVAWTLHFDDLHRNLDVYTLQQLGDRSDAELADWCRRWGELRQASECAPLARLAEACGLPQAPAEARRCSYALLEWLHGGSDLLGCLLYFLLFPLKLTVLLVLRADVLDLAWEIVYRDHKSEYRHWMTLAEAQERSEEGEPLSPGSGSLGSAPNGSLRPVQRRSEDSAD